MPSRYDLATPIDSEVPFRIHKERSLVMPLSFITLLLVSTAIGVRLWVGTSKDLERTTEDVRKLDQRTASDVRSLEQRVTFDHDLLLEIRGDVKNLVRAQRRNGDTP